ncbi:MAG: Dabb family protein, partial [Clostridia bacterium]|nr:Dabb family protein [Clostridia bacterium]
MIRHIVMFKFKEEADGRTKAENVAITKSMLDALPGKIDWILS